MTPTLTTRAAQDQPGNGPSLFSASTYGFPAPTLLSTARIKALLAAGADIDATDAAGFTPAMAAIRERRPELLRLLVAMGADLARTNINRFTAAHLAVALGRPESLAILMEAGADILARDKHGQTPLDLAKNLLETSPFAANQPHSGGDYPGCLEVAQCFADLRALQKSTASPERRPGAPHHTKKRI
jgi:hypothetical protein